MRATPTGGSEPIDRLGCNLWTFRDGEVVCKNTDWKYIDKGRS